MAFRDAKLPTRVAHSQEILASDDPEVVGRTGSPVSKKAAKLVAAEMKAMERDGVPRTPHNLVERARDKRSPIHDLFEWNDKAAADIQRINWARKLMSNTMIIVFDPRMKKREVRASFPIEIRMESPARTIRVFTDRDEVVLSSSALAQVEQRYYKAILGSLDEIARIPNLARKQFWKRMIADSKLSLDE